VADAGSVRGRDRPEPETDSEDREDADHAAETPPSTWTRPFRCHPSN
jgi:hypothetical protein